MTTTVARESARVVPTVCLLSHRAIGEYAVPTLPSRNLHETLAFYERLGFANAGDAAIVWDYDIRMFSVVDPSGNRILFGASPH
jgi:hypothetical protein